MRNRLIKGSVYGAMIFFPLVTTFGRTGIVVRSLQDMEEVHNPPWLVGINGVAIAIAYWALFSRHTVAYLSDQLVKRNLLSPDIEVDINSGEVENYKRFIQNNRHTNLFGKFGYTSGFILGMSEGVLNFLGSRHLLVLMQSKNDYINFFFPLIFGISSTVCWVSMVAPKARDILRGQSTVFSHDNENKLAKLQHIFGSIFGGFTGLTAGLGLAATVTYGILALIKLIEEGQSVTLPVSIKLLVASPFMFFSALSASLFYMSSNSKLVSELFLKYREILQINLDCSESNIFGKLLRIPLCALVIIGGAYATYTLSYVSIQVTLLAFVNLFSQETVVTDLPSYFSIFKIISSLSLAFTATAVSGREGFRFIMSKNDLSASASSDRVPLLGADNHSKCSLWFRNFYRDKTNETTKARLIKEEAENSLQLTSAELKPAELADGGVMLAF